MMSEPRENGMDNTRSFVPISIGTMISHYKIIEKIGAGGMGEVYLAEDTKLNRDVALKFLPSHLCQDEDCRARFKREAQAAAKLSHPNIMTIHEVGDYQGRPYIVMEHVEGRSLKEFSTDTDLSMEQILELFIQICEGLNDAHEKGVTHRDIKPTNILVDSHGRVKIVDFGLASVVGTDQLTKAGSTLGTIGYMSPEQVRGQEIDHRSDLFSLGVVLYELITKQNPFKRDSEAATLKAVCDNIPEPLARFRRAVPEGLQGIIDKASEKDVRTRYQHADGMLADLMRVKRSLESGQSTDSVTAVARRPAWVWWIAGVVVVVVAVAALIVTKPWITETATDQPEKIMLVVLPFENLGDPEDEYFADGITDEITSRLASVHNLGVISRTSAYAYKESDKTLPQIANDLGVDYVLEGTVRWDKSGDTDRVRITPQLIRVSDDMHLWADNYEEALTGIFSVQTAIASNIVKALDLALSDSDRNTLAVMPTRNPEAFDYYLRGKRFDASNTDEVNRAESLLQRAIELDPEFALAHVRLAHLYSEMYWWSQFYDPSEEWLVKAKRHVDSALTLQPDLADAYAAKGWYYFRGGQDYRSAQKYLELALDRQPNNAEWHRSVGVIQRRQGKWGDALRSFEQALRLDPRSASLAATYAGTLVSTRNYEKAEKMFDRAVELAPNSKWLYIEKSMLYLLWRGDTKQARDVVSKAVRQSGRWPMLSYVEMQLDLIDGDYEHALALCSKVGSVYTGALSDSAEYYYKRAEVLRQYQPELAVAYCDSARVILEREIRNNPDASYSRVFLGQLYAWLGRGDDGVREGLLAVESYPMAKDAVSAPDLISVLTEIYISVGDYESAIDQIDFLLSVPSWISVPYLRVDPKFDPLRDHPRFQALLEKYE